MGTRIVTTDTEIIAAIIEAFNDDAVFPISMAPGEHDINHAAHVVVRMLTAPPEKTSDITGFKEDDG